MKSIPFTECVDLVGSRCKPFKGTKKYVSTGAVDVDQINEAGIEIIDYEKRPSRANLEASLGDVLFAKMQGTKKTLLISSSLVENIYSTGFCAVKAKENVLTERCLYHLLTSKMFLEQKDKNCSGATQKAITNKGLQKVILHVPDINKQDLIAAQLDLIVKIITLRKQELVELDDLIKARFIELFGEPGTNPMNWKETTIGEECFYIKDGPHKSLPDIGKENGGHPFISVRNIVDGYINFSNAKYISDEDYAAAIKKCHPEKGDMLYSKGGTTGIAKLIDVEDKFANWVHVAVLKFGKEKLNGVFFENMLNSTYCYEQSQRLTKGIANRDLVLSAMAQIKMYRPPLELQNQFADFVSQIDKSKATVQKALDETQLLFDSLMQQYFG